MNSATAASDAEVRASAGRCCVAFALRRVAAAGSAENSRGRVAPLCAVHAGSRRVVYAATLWQAHGASGAHSKDRREVLIGKGPKDQ